MKIRKFLEVLAEGIDRVLRWKGLPYLVLVLVSIYLLFPLYWAFVTSFKSFDEVMRWPPSLIPRHFTLASYIHVLTHSPIPLYLANSVFYALSVTAVVMITATLTTYGLSLYPYKGSGEVFLTFFALRIIPPQSLWLPFIIFFSRAGLMNTRPAVIIFLITFIYPLSIWLLKGIFDAFPRELRDSATVDGCSRIGVLFHIVLPIVAPGVAAIGIVAFLWAWSEFMFPFLVLNSDVLKPITLGIFYFVGDENCIWNALAAAEVLAITPGLVLFVVLQRHIVRGLSAGAIKE